MTDSWNKEDSTMVQAQPYGNNSDFVSDSSPWVTKKQPRKCRDPVFAVLLYANLAAIIGVYIKYGQNITTDETADATDDQLEDTDYTPIVYTAAALAGFSAVFSAILMQVLMCIPGFLIKAALFFNIGLAAVAAAVSIRIFPISYFTYTDILCIYIYVNETAHIQSYIVFQQAGFYYGNLIMGIIGLVFLAIMCCYAKLVWSRIPFATANLKTGCAAVKANCGIIVMAYIFTVLAVGWSILWSLAVAGIQDTLITCKAVVVDGETTTVCSDPNYGVWFVLFISFFFMHQVLQNSVHCAVAGVVGSWWFTPNSSGCCSSAVCGSFIRTMTTSFGSICFGSLLVAIVQALRQIIQMAKNNDDIGQFLACCLDCLLSCIESLLEYFNKWAFVYVGVYGYSYCEAGKSVMQLFKDRGWEAVIADDLVGMALFMTSVVVGLLGAGAGVVIIAATSWWDAFIEVQGDSTAKIIAAM
jgi:hypothetical protein